MPICEKCGNIKAAEDMVYQELNNRWICKECIDDKDKEDEDYLTYMACMDR